MTSMNELNKYLGKKTPTERMAHYIGTGINKDIQLLERTFCEYVNAKMFDEAEKQVVLCRQLARDVSSFLGEEISIEYDVRVDLMKKVLDAEKGLAPIEDGIKSVKNSLEKMRK